MARNAQLNVRIRAALKAKLERLAKEDRRTVSAYVEKLLEDHVETLHVEQRSGAITHRDTAIAGWTPALWSVSKLLANRASR